ncbi:putative Kunitz-type serine protease inhibitor [Xenopus laevis]|uniref:Kunitz-type serine protease inhibitor n=2 Tax=Xenopus laevis TaxID=8355 RepID=A0A1L8F3U3_XENLA|nr:putative Kunitz-type serine protease inhibitor [Xenopus laevis]OCT66248.1 hypothetical protein XELAEV_18042506mg [Xenopus laevis]
MAMAVCLAGLLLLMFPLAHPQQPPCDGYEVLDGLGVTDARAEAPRINNLLNSSGDVNSDQECWALCCSTERCELAEMSDGICKLFSCLYSGLSVCQLEPKDGARSYRKKDIGPTPTLKAELSNDILPPSKSVVEANVDQACTGNGVTGICRASFPRWYFNAESQTCVSFTYGGCGGTENNHKSEKECRDRCIVSKPEPAKVQAPKTVSYSEYCAAPSLTGPCRASFSRWYYDTTSGQCATFTYGGCRGNKNNYLSEDDCVKNCVGRSDDDHTSEQTVLHRYTTVSKPEPAKVQAPKTGSYSEYCAAPSLTGPCRASFSRWYYDTTSGQCATFIYGGCRGNKNNYLSEDDCVKNCVGRSDDDHTSDQTVLHKSMTTVVLPILLAMLAGILLFAMIVFFVKMAKKNQRDAALGAIWSPIDDKECLMNNAYTI